MEQRTFDPTLIVLAEETKLSPPHLWAIAAGASLSQRNGHFLNTIATGLSEEEARNILSQWWNIKNADDLRTTLTWLHNEGHRIYFEPVTMFAQMGEEERETAIRTYMPAASFDTLDSFSANLADYLEGEEDELQEALMEVTDILAWDAVRGINLTRWAYDCKMIDEESALNTICFFAQSLKDKYASWEELGFSYLMGRLIWGGEDDEFYIMFQCLTELIGNEKSPWVKLPWDMKFKFIRAFD